MATNSFLAHIDSDLSEFDSFTNTGSGTLVESATAKYIGAGGLLITPDGNFDGADLTISTGMFVQKNLTAPWASNIVWVSYWLQIPIMPVDYGPDIFYCWKSVGSALKANHSLGNEGIVGGKMGLRFSLQGGAGGIHTTIYIPAGVWLWVTCEHQMRTSTPFTNFLSAKIYNADGTVFAGPSTATATGGNASSNANGNVFQFGSWNSVNTSVVWLDELQVTDTMPSPPTPPACATNLNNFLSILSPRN